MPALKSTFNNRSRSLDARPDRYDVRDRKYQPRLVNLPQEYPASELVGEMLPSYLPLVLDQKSEGACTGFGLAAMINYLRFKSEFLEHRSSRKKKKRQPPPKVSTRMLYENARLYDEWPGEDYEGSSCRGAMKGWHRHGVCLEETWPYKAGAKPAAHWQTEAAKIALGAYYRVETDDITALQSAIFEVGAVYVSADVHGGWNVEKHKSDLPRIPWEEGDEVDGGHAFALVGYDSRGFIIQNSWGQDWGYCGFALLSYEDWLTNATDAWVATLGVERPAHAVPANYSSHVPRVVAGKVGTGGGPAGSGSESAMGWSEDAARNHCLVLGNDGVILRASAAHDSTAFVQDVVLARARSWMAADKHNRRIAVYAHGGLNDEDAAIKRARIMGPWFMANGIYPVFVVWKTGWQESLLNIGEDVLMKLKPGTTPAERAAGLLGWIGERVGEAWDYTVETTLGFLGKSLWRQMKQNAEGSGAEDHGGDLLARALVNLCATVRDSEVHLIGHSAGTIWNGRLLTMLRGISDGKFRAASCHLLAAACTVPFANEHYAAAVTAGVVPAGQLWSHLLSDAAERADNVGGFYRKSLLYFVSRACEEHHKMPILGMEAAWNKGLDKQDRFHKNFDEEVAAWRSFVRDAKVPAPVRIEADDAVFDGARRGPPCHGGFDNDIHVMNRTLATILGLGPSEPPPKPVTSLSGF